MRLPCSRYDGFDEERLSASEMHQNIFEFWSYIAPNERVHPADAHVFRRVEQQGFDLRCLPGPYFGPLKTAPVVFLYLSPGFSDLDLQEAESREGQARYVRQRTGTAPLPTPEDHKPAWLWWSRRTQLFGDWQELRHMIAFLNIGAYHSADFSDWPLLAALPSSRVSLEWAQDVLFPEAEAGKRVVVCLRAARYWGLEEGKRYDAHLYAPAVVRSGFMRRLRLEDQQMRDQIISAVREVCDRG